MVIQQRLNVFISRHGMVAEKHQILFPPAVGVTQNVLCNIPTMWADSDSRTPWMVFALKTHLDFAQQPLKPHLLHIAHTRRRGKKFDGLT
jgi:hypothetical protein